MEEILIDDANDNYVIETPAALAKSSANAASGAATDSSSPRVMSMLYIHPGNLQTNQSNNNSSITVNQETSVVQNRTKIGPVSHA